MKQLNLVPSDLMQKTGASRWAVSQWRNDIAKATQSSLVIATHAKMIDLRLYAPLCAFMRLYAPLCAFYDV